MIDPCCSYEIPDGHYVVPEQLATPTGVEGAAEGTDTIDLTWESVTDAESYLVEYRLAGDSDWSELVVTDSQATVTGLEADTDYEFRVTARADGYTDSDPSSVVTVTTGSETTQLAAPTGVEAVADGPNIIDLTWESVTDAQTYTVEYRIEGEDEWSDTEPDSDTSTSIVGLDADTTYELRVIAHAEGFDDSDPSTTVTATTEEDPPPQLDAPTGVSSPGQGESSIDVEWSAVTDAESYLVRWSVSGEGDWSESSSVSDTDYTVSELSSATEYDIQVSATAAGYTQSDWSDTITESTEG